MRGVFFVCIIKLEKEVSDMFNNGYGYVPYYTSNNYNNAYVSQQRQGLLGKQVDSIESARLTEYQLDGSTSYFPLLDGSAVVSKQLQMDGTSKMVIYKPVESEDKKSYVTSDELDAILNDIKLIKEELESIKKGQGE